MSADQPRDPEPNPQGPKPSEPGRGMFTQEIHNTQVSARVPEKVGKGVFSTGVIAFQGPNEFVLDFVLRMVQPQQIVARVVLAPTIVPSVIGALRESLNLYQSKFGPPPPLPAPPNPTPPNIEEIYGSLKLPDDMLSGVYANAVMIGHSPAEFYFDFITNFYPRSAVSCRVFLSAPQVPGFLKTLADSYHQHQQKLAQQPPKPGGPR